MKINEPLLYAAIDSIILERHRQHGKWGEQRHSLEYWLTILIEEVGELAQAIQKAKGDGKDSDSDNLLEEAIHAGAVTTAIIEQLIEQMEGVADDGPAEPEDIFGPEVLSESEPDGKDQESGSPEGT